MNSPQPRTEHWTPNPDPTSITIPGVDATASVNDQIDQIDQLITIRLQNIDANFSRIQHIISTKLLPAFKRYAEGTEPVREAARFWKSFYEAAAQVRIPIANDTSSLYHTEDENSERDTAPESILEPDSTPSNVDAHDDSFARGAPVSSTPLIRDPIYVVPSRDAEDDESWAATIESSAPSEPTAGTPYFRHRQLPASNRNRTPKNPFLPQGSTSQQWNGIVDLRQPSPAKSETLRASRMPERSAMRDGNESDSSDDLFPPGMSPPVTMQFAMPSRIQRSAVKLALTPARRAAERISHGLVVKAAAKDMDARSPGKLFPLPSSDSGSDSDSKSSEHDESNPSAAFLLAAQNNARAGIDDSFASSQHSMSSDEDEDDVLRAARHPLAHLFASRSEGGSVEDSFDNSFADAQGEEETVFGSHQVGQLQGGTRLHIMRDAVIDNTYTGAPSLNPYAQVEQSPTPHSGSAEELH